MLRTVQRRIMSSLQTQCSRMLSDSSTTPAVPAEDEGEPGVQRRAERGLNKVTLIGRVGREPEQRGTQDHPCVIFPLATNLTYRKATGERMTKTDWHRVCVFKPSLQKVVSSNVARGDRLFVEGSLSYQRYTDNENKSAVITSIVAEEVIFLGQRRGNQSDEDEGH